MSEFGKRFPIKKVIWAMADRITNIDTAESGLKGPHSAAFVDSRVHQLEAICAVIGARVAALEGVVFALQDRVRKLEAMGCTEMRPQNLRDRS